MYGVSMLWADSLDYRRRGGTVSKSRSADPRFQPAIAVFERQLDKMRHDWTLLF
jgi:hypothetical protein